MEEVIIKGMQGEMASSKTGNYMGDQIMENNLVGQTDSKTINPREASMKAHCLLLAYPAQGHLNPMLQLAKRLQHKGCKATLVAPLSIVKNIRTTSSSSVALETISDGYDGGGVAEAESMAAYVDRFWRVGPETLTQLIERLNSSSSSTPPVDCLVYNSFLTWALDVANKFGLRTASFFTQACAVNIIYYHVSKSFLKLPLTEADDQILIPGLPPFQLQELPSFVYLAGEDHIYLHAAASQFDNVDQADWILWNTVYELEAKEVDFMKKLFPAIRTVGPTIPSIYLDKQVDDDKEYGFSIFKPSTDACINWLNDRPKGSVVYVSFGSMVDLDARQMEELVSGLKASDCYFLWVVRASEQAKLPKCFIDDEGRSEKGLVVTWCRQLEVLAHDSIGCFITHCGWNSTLEGLSLGVPMVGMPRWSDQHTNAKYIKDVWKMGLRASADEKGMVRGETIEQCIREIIEGEKGKEIKRNSENWKRLTKQAMEEGESSGNNIDEFIADLVVCRHR